MRRELRLITRILVAALTGLGLIAPLRPGTALAGSRANHIESRRPPGFSPSVIPGGGTASLLTSSEGDFDQVRVILLNASLAPYAIDGVSVAASRTVGDGFTPSGGPGAFKRLTWTGGGRCGTHASAGGHAVAPPPVPAGAGVGHATVYGVGVCSDWTRIRSQPWTGGDGVQRLLLVRLWSQQPYSGSDIKAQAYNSMQDPSQSLGRPFRVFHQPVNGVDQPQAFTAPVEDYRFNPAIIVQFRSRRRVIDITGVGDSLTQGHQLSHSASEQVTLGGDFTQADVISLTLANPAIRQLPVTVSYRIRAGDTAASVAAALGEAIGATPGGGSSILGSLPSPITASATGAVLTVAQPSELANGTRIEVSQSGAKTERITLSGPDGRLAGGAGAFVMGDFASWGQFAAAGLSTARRPVMWTNLGYGGDIHAAIFDNAVAFLQVLTPDVLIFPLYSANDRSLTPAMVEDNWRRDVAIAARCRAKGVRIVFTTPIPAGSVTPKPLVMEFKRRLEQAGFHYLDWYALMQDGSDPPRLNRDYDSGDAIHPSLAGHRAMGAEAERRLHAWLRDPPRR